MIQRKDGRYQEQTTINGKRVYFYGKTVSEVKRKMAAYNKDITTGKLFKAVADEWDAKHREIVTYNAWATYIAPLRRVKEHFKGYAKDITPGQIQAYINSLGGLQYAKRTVQLYLDMLRMVFDHAVVSGYTDTNPCSSVHLPSGLSSSKRELPSNNCVDVIKASVDRAFGLFAYFAMYSGLRRGELLALRYDDIDFENKTIRVNKSVYYEVNQPKIKVPKTKAGFRNVILLDVLSEKLDRKGKGFIFGGDAPLTQTVYRRRWSNYIKDVGINITPHQLRHAFATFLFEAGIQDKDAQDLLGHSSIQVTRDIYTHIRDSRRNETAEKLNLYVKSLSDAK